MVYTKNIFFEILLAANIVHSKYNEIARKHSEDHILSIHYYQYPEFWFRMSLDNCLPQIKLSSLELIIFTF